MHKCLFFSSFIGFISSRIPKTKTLSENLQTYLFCHCTFYSNMALFEISAILYLVFVRSKEGRALIAPGLISLPQILSDNQFSLQATNAYHLGCFDTWVIFRHHNTDRGRHSCYTSFFSNPNFIYFTSDGTLTEARS